MLPESHHSPSAPSRTSRPLRRGRACVNCRFLKIKCDGAKPVCGPCLRHPKDDGCEYTDAQGRSRTKVLEETIASLEARLRELEHPDESTPSVTLHDPYGHYHQPQLYTSSFPESPRTETILSSYSPISPSFDSPSSRSFDSPASGSFYLPSTSSPLSGSSGGSSNFSGQPPSPVSFLGQEEPPSSVIQTLLDNFSPSASEFGFFLNFPRFRNSVLQSPFDQRPRPTPGLLSVVYLWGVHLSQSDLLVTHEDVFLSRALHRTATDLSSTHPYKVLHTIQAEVLLANYFFRKGRVLEAKCHAAGAVSLSIGCGLHRLRSSQPLPRTNIGSIETANYLHTPENDVEEGELINGFWAVFMLHKSLAAAVDPPSNLCGALEAPGLQIDTPWPMDMESYEEGLLSQSPLGGLTVRNFLTGSGGNSELEFSMVAMAVKASILFHRASYLSGQWSPSMQAFPAAFQSLDGLIEGFRASLPPVAKFGDRQHARSLVVTHALADAAVIKLHHIFSYASAASKHKCLAAATAIIKSAKQDIMDFGYINPMMGSLWVAACQVFIDEISRMKAHQGNWVPGVPNVAEDALWSCLNEGLLAMSHFSRDSPMMSYQLTKVQAAYTAI